jgi:uncharacterized cupin superfamily protein
MLIPFDLTLQPDNGLMRQPDLTLDVFLHGERERWGRLFYDRPEIGVTAGLWYSRPFTSKPFTFGGFEFVHLIAGALEIVTQTGTFTIQAGDSVMIPAGLQCVFRQTDEVCKVFIRWDAPNGSRDPSWFHSVWQRSVHGDLYTASNSRVLAGGGSHWLSADQCSPLLAIVDSGGADGIAAYIAETTAEIPSTEAVLAWAGLQLNRA